MKKFLSLLLILALMFIVGCNNVVPDTPPEDNPPEDTPPVSGPTAFAYTMDDLASVKINYIENNITLDLSANTELKQFLCNLRYDAAEQVSDDTPVTKYILTFGGNTLTVLEGGIARYNGDEAVAVMDEDFSYLDGLVAGEVENFKEYSADLEIKAYNHQNFSCEVADKEAFLENLNKVKFVKLSNKEHYALERENYKINIGEDTIKIHGSLVVLGEELFAVCEGDFNFLAKLTYKSDSSGFLPWI